MHLNYNLIWFVLLGVLLTGYAILDGFDFGVGILHLFAKEDEDRRIFLNSIGPLWDGNEVWLVTFGGALFAAFPNAYATAFSGFYMAFMLLLCALIFRAVSIEFRSKQPHGWWKQAWDIGFAVSSTSCAFLFGVLAGDSFIGLPIGADMVFTGTVRDLFRPYPVLVGAFTVATCAMHGSIYLYLKTEGELQKKIHHWMWTTFGIFITFYMFTTNRHSGYCATGHSQPDQIPNGLAGSGFERSRYRQYSPGDLHQQTRIRVHLFLLHHCRPDIFIRSCHVPELDRVSLRSCFRYQCLQRCIIAKDPGHHAHSCRPGICLSWPATPPSFTGCSEAKCNWENSVTEVCD